MAKTKDGKKPAEKPALAVKAERGKTARPANDPKSPEPVKPAKEPQHEKTVSEEEIALLRGPVEEAKAKLELARKEAEALEVRACEVIAGARESYRAALVPYREACRKAKVPCDFEGSRSANVAEKVSFLVERVEKGIRVRVKGRPETEEVISLAVLKESVQKAAYGYAEKHLGPREEIGNKGGSLYNRLRKVMA